MALIDVAREMVDNNPDTLKVISRILSEAKEPATILSILVSYNITGINIAKLFNICCNGDIKKLTRTMQFMEVGVFDEKHISKNMKLDNPVEFLNDEMFKGRLSYDKPFGPYHEGWDETCLAVSENFTERLKSKLGKCA